MTGEERLTQLIADATAEWRQTALAAEPPSTSRELNYRRFLARRLVGEVIPRTNLERVGSWRTDENGHPWLSVNVQDEPWVAVYREVETQ